ncbi:hypothetical protein [Rhizobium sp. SSA_523]|uniref:hypothetical protein n=1 Tax=Rhizobium sp. SSA_523 TaxID=2952477 RepID=UPI002090E250|nr:hypothetical protein [Rhizobium sp. SSA_523]MCO5732828.1 hypothetical protein [Rhizobium sp. SSA_523]WKC23554.1 hypothetical protein QTJ18_22610 [Rhizobium sp. SSA_523]
MTEQDHTQDRVQNRPGNTAGAGRLLGPGVPGTPIHPAAGPTPTETPMSATEARQGRRGTPVFMVLAIGLVLAMLAWGGVEWWAQTNEPPAEQTATPPAGDTTPVNPNAAPTSNP